MAECVAVKVYPPAATACEPRRFIDHQIHYAQVAEEGAIIHGKPLLWLPLPTAPVGGGGRRIPPAQFQQQAGMPLYTHSPAGQSAAVSYLEGT